MHSTQSLASLTLQGLQQLQHSSSQQSSSHGSCTSSAPAPVSATSAIGVASTVSIVGNGAHGKPRKTNFTAREVETLLHSVRKHRDVILFGVAGGRGWADAWTQVAEAVSTVDGIHRSEGDVRKKWTYLKWEAKNTSKPCRDATSRAVLEILTGCSTPAATTCNNTNSALTSALGGNNTTPTETTTPAEPPRTLLEELLVPQQQSSQLPKATQSNATTPSLLKKRPDSSQSQSQGPIQREVSTRASPQPSKVRVASPQTPPSTQPEVCLRWNSYQTNLQETFPSLLVNGQFVDVTLACEGKSIRCHKIILSACSNYLESLLTQNPCQHPIILLKDMRFWEVQALVDFMYRGEVNISQENLPNLLSAAEALQIKGLAGTGGTYGTNQEESNKSQIIEGSREENSPSPSNARRIRKKKITSLTFNQTQSTQSTSANVQRLIARSRILKQSCSPSPSTSAVSLENPNSPIRKFAKKEPLHFLEGIKVEPIEESSTNDNDSNSFDFTHRDSDCIKQFYETTKHHNQDSKNEMDCSDDSDLQTNTPQEIGNEHPSYPEVIMDTDTTPN